MSSTPSVDLLVPPPGGAPIAIVGLACRLPGAPDPAAFWALLRDGRHAVTEVPPARWRPAGPDDPTRWGCFLPDVDGFDAGFFGISPREARMMDPQQRLLLELAWEGIEDTGVPADQLTGRPVGVFIGAMADDYAKLVYGHGAGGDAPHVLTGLHRSVLANRISYRLGFSGPSLTVDAGQSSSLLAVHVAAESLRSGECEIALAGGVNLNLLADTARYTADFGALSPDGRCYTFDERANGYVRGEGAALVVLKPLDQAVADGDRVYCVIRGGATNHDGGGDRLTAPSQAGQEQVLRRAYERAGVPPAQVGYVELHGTGTPVGDPVEAAALGAVLGRARPAGDPLVVGSVKTNIGHLEGAAGIAGLLKVVLALRHRELPASLNFRSAGPAIPLGELGLRVGTELGPWPGAGGPLLAGVSAFGMGGTNCHLVLAEAPRGTAGTGAAPVTGVGPATGVGPVPVLISGRSAAAVRAQARRLADWWEGPGRATPVPAVARALAASRTGLEHRAVVVGADRESIVADLRSVAVEASGTLPGGVVLVFPGQGWQWAGMARELIGASPVFADRLAACDRALSGLVDWSVIDVLGSEDDSWLSRVDVLQPLLWSVMVSLGAVWQSSGVPVTGVVGHSQGEVAAACVAGGLSLEDGARIVVVRSRLIRELAGTGGMLSVGLSRADVEPELPDGVEAAVVNSGSSTVVAGPVPVLEALAARWTERGVRARLIPVDYASHSAAVDSVADRLVAELDGLTPRSSPVPLVSTATGEVLDTAGMDGRYWLRNLRHTVRFDLAMQTLVGLGARVFVEVSAHPVLELAMSECVEAAGVPGVVVASQRRDRPQYETLLHALGQVWAVGAPVDWTTVLGSDRTHVDLPTYAFQRARHWFTAEPANDGTADGGAEITVQTSDLGELTRAVAARVLGHERPDDIDVDRPFKDLGFDSSLSLELCRRLGAAVGATLPVSVVFNHPTVTALVAHLTDRIGGAPAVASGTTVLPSDEPLAIVGMACRFPGGVDSPEDLWRVVVEGRDVVGDFPVDRGWTVDGSFARVGGFIDSAADFDPELFGISPREALAMDPQQRILLEVSWEALERAGIAPDSLRGSPAGVFVGLMSQEYGPRLGEADAQVEGYGLTGGSISVASGRIAYVLSLEGPAVSVDTACSSSLVALHLAGQALRVGECDLALVGGATVMSTPGLFVEFDRQGGLAGDGRCKAFSAAADGTGWSEGVGVLVVQRLADAIRDGRRVLGVVRGSAVNQDGASNGLTAPNGVSQQRVIRQALAAARVDAADVDVVEAHGTGTRLGDPIEAQALVATYGAARNGRGPVWLGSLKSNVGHTQAAAGVAGVMKMVLALRAGALPRTLHVDEPSPLVDWDGGVRLLSEPVQLVRDGRPWRAAVSSFGISGTNAHVIVEAPPLAPELPAESPVDGSVVTPVVVSARGAAALREQAGRLADWLEHEGRDVPLPDVARTLALSRAALEHRVAVVGDDHESVAASLRAATALTPVPSGATGVVLVFPGQGWQWAGMARELLTSSTVFADRLAECDLALSDHVDWSVTDILQGEDEMWLSRVDVVQPVLWAVMVSLGAVWLSWGVPVTGVIGHSQGEVAAACVAGGLSLADGAWVVVVRSRLVRELAGTGGMLSVGLGRTEIEPQLPEGVEIAVVNSAASTVVAGPVAVLETLAAQLAERGVRARMVPVDYASHSAAVDALADRLMKQLDALTPRSSQIPVISTVTGDVFDTTGMDADYWLRNLRQTVRFDTAMQTLTSRGARVFVEVSAHPVLELAMSECAPDSVVISSQRRDRPQWNHLLTALGQAWAAGVRVDWATVHSPGAIRTDLPTYAFQHQRFWLTPTTAAGQHNPDHPVLAASTHTTADEPTILTGRLDPRTLPWLADHAVRDTTMLPGTAFIEWLVHTGDHLGHNRIADVIIHTPLTVHGHIAHDIHIVCVPVDGSAHTARVYARRHGFDNWTLHAEGRLDTTDEPADNVVGPWPPEGAQPAPIDTFYTDVAAAGYQYGPAFQGMRQLWRRGDTLHAEVALPAEEPATGVAIHPALLDAALHPLLTADELRLPFAWTGIRVHATGARRARVAVTPTGPDSARIRLTDDDGRPIVDIDELRLRALPAVPMAASLATVSWVPPESAPATDTTGSTPPVVVYSPPAGNAVADTLAELQRFLGSTEQTGGRLLVLTRDALVAPAEGQVDPAGVFGAAVWGLVRSAQSEHPGRFLLRDVPTDVEPDLDALLTTAEEQAVLRAEGVLVPRLQPARPVAAEAPTLGDGWVLVTGGTSGVGALVAEHLVCRHAVTRLLLLSRSGPNADGVAALVDRLEALGATVRVVACDVSDRAQLQRVLDDVDRLVGVVHAAGVLDDGVLEGLSTDRVADVLNGKLGGALLLHELTLDRDLAMFVVFSSVAGVLGNAGQASYAAANAGLDGLALLRAGMGLPVTSIAWGLWETQTGMTRGMRDRDRSRLKRSAVEAMPTGEALTLFDAAISGVEPVVVAATLNLSRVADPAPPMLRRLTHRSGPTRRRAIAPTDAGVAEQELATLRPAQRQRWLRDLVRAHVAGVLGHGSPEAVDLDRPFKEVGFDSLTAVDLRNRLAAAVGKTLPATVVFDHPTPAALADHLDIRLGGGNGNRSADNAHPVVESLERLTEVLDNADAADLIEHRVTHRLRTLLSRLDGGTDGDPDDLDADLLEASDDELYEFLQHELGITHDPFTDGSGR
ncbi:SDR family NAD(P)-dependent oxidoreductase [Micromonospora sp. NPDC047620]|uniref:type I polyketide synthase n=1 Tax=Micromonospora sp. NPDC047620 TaxID=3364251 RepID=UPI00371D96B6